MSEQGAGDGGRGAGEGAAGWSLAAHATELLRYVRLRAVLDEPGVVFRLRGWAGTGRGAAGARGVSAVDTEPVAEGEVRTPLRKAIDLPVWDQLDLLLGIAGIAAGERAPEGRGGGEDDGDP